MLGRNSYLRKVLSLAAGGVAILRCGLPAGRVAIEFVVLQTYLWTHSTASLGAVEGLIYWDPAYAVGRPVVASCQCHHKRLCSRIHILRRYSWLAPYPEIQWVLSRSELCDLGFHPELRWPPSHLGQWQMLIRLDQY